MIKIDYNKCCWKDGKCTSGCGCSCKGCVEVCPEGALIRGDMVKVENDKCTSCGLCVSACPHDAIVLK